MADYQKNWTKPAKFSASSSYGFSSLSLIYDMSIWNSCLFNIEWSIL